MRTHKFSRGQKVAATLTVVVTLFLGLDILSLYPFPSADCNSPTPLPTTTTITTPSNRPSSTPSASFSPSITPPAISITYPVYQTVGGVVTVTANASSLVGIRNVTFYIDGVQIGLPDPTSPYGIAVNMNNYASSSLTSHTLTAKATDNNGLTTSVTTTFYVAGTSTSNPTPTSTTSPSQSPPSSNTTNSPAPKSTWIHRVTLGLVHAQQYCASPTPAPITANTPAVSTTPPALGPNTRPVTQKSTKSTPQPTKNTGTSQLVTTPLQPNSPADLAGPIPSVIPKGPDYSSDLTTPSSAAQAPTAPQSSPSLVCRVIGALLPGCVAASSDVVPGTKVSILPIECQSILTRLFYPNTCRKKRIKTTVTVSDLPNYTISIVGEVQDSKCVTVVTRALHRLQVYAPLIYTNLVTKNIGQIECVKNQPGGMQPYEDPPREIISEVNLQGGEIWLAGIIAHDAAHADIYRVYRDTHNGQAPDEIYWATSEESQRAGLDKMRIALQLTGADSQVIQFVDSIIDNNFTGVPALPTSDGDASL